VAFRFAARRDLLVRVVSQSLDQIQIDTTKREKETCRKEQISLSPKNSGIEQCEHSPYNPGTNHCSWSLGPATYLHHHPLVK
jgi:hypothetical protein